MILLLSRCSSGIRSLTLKLSWSSVGFYAFKTSIVRESEPCRVKASLQFLKRGEKVLEVTAALLVDETVFDDFLTLVYCFVKRCHGLRRAIPSSNLFWYFKKAPSAQQQKGKGYPRISQSRTEATWNVNLSFASPLLLPPSSWVATFLWKLPDLNIDVGIQEPRHFTEARSYWRKRRINRLLLTTCLSKRQTHTCCHSPKAVYDTLWAFEAW